MNDLAARKRIEAHVAKRVGTAFDAWYASVYASIRELQKRQPAVDWDEERKRFLILLIAAMAWAGDELAAQEQDEWAAQQLELDSRTVLDEYEAEGSARLQAIAEVTERHSRLEIAAWQPQTEPFASLVERLQKWYSETRAARIATMETGFMMSATARVIMRRLGLHRWLWIHGETCRTGPCLAMCAPNEGRIFSEQELMPPACSHVMCDCFGQPIE